MPQIATLTVKKADNTTNVVYDALVPSSGDKSPALWYLTAAGAAPAFRPQLSLQSAWNGPRTARRLQVGYKYPVWATGTDGVTRIVDTLIIDATILRPAGMADSTALEAIAQFAHLVDAQNVRDSVTSGHSPT